MSKVTKAVIPVAGRGTRLRPLTLHTPKELLPVGGKPLIQYSLEMHMDAGISEFFIITSPRKPQIEAFVTGSWKPPALPFERDGSFYDRLTRCRVVFSTQAHPSGIADAIALARDFVGNEPFACIMPDCLLFSREPQTAQISRVFEKEQTHVIGTIAISGPDAGRFGNVGLLKTKRVNDGCFSIESLSDKTKEPLSAGRGESIHKGFGGGVYLPEYFDLVDLIRDEAKGEVDDVPIHHILIREGKLLGVLLKGAAFDAGHPRGFRAAVHYAGRLFP